MGKSLLLLLFVAGSDKIPMSNCNKKVKSELLLQIAFDLSFFHKEALFFHGMIVKAWYVRHFEWFNFLFIIFYYSLYCLSVI